MFCFIFYFYDSQPVPMPRKRYNADNLLPTRPPEVPLRLSVPPLKQNQACVRTSATEHLTCSNTASVKNQDSGLSSVLSNQKILNKKVQNKTSGMQAFINTEINEVLKKKRNTENKYEEITEEHTICSPHYPYADVTNRGTPQEYLPPPPFAPGYWYPTGGTDQSNLTEVCIFTYAVCLNMGSKGQRLHWYW